MGKTDTALANYAVATSHQPGARHAPFHFLSGKLFTPNVADTVYAHLRVPTLVVYDRDGYVTFDRVPEIVRTNEYFTSIRLQPSKGLPHFEREAETARALEEFWSACDRGAGARNGGRPGKRVETPIRP